MTDPSTEAPPGEAAPAAPEAAAPAAPGEAAPVEATPAQPPAADGQASTQAPAVAEAPPEAPAATPHDFGELAATAPAGGGGSLNMLFDLMMPISVELGRTAMTVREVLDLSRGSVIPLNRLAGEPIDIYVSDRKLAEGEVVVLGEHFGVRLTKIVNDAPVPGGLGQGSEARSA